MENCSAILFAKQDKYCGRRGCSWGGQLAPTKYNHKSTAYPPTLTTSLPFRETIPIVFVGDERQLAPYSGVDPNVAVEPLLKDTSFARYLTSFSQAGDELEFCKPTLLRTQHRAHSTIAAVFSSFAYEGIVETGRRCSSQFWMREKVAEMISNSFFPAKPKIVLQYDGKRFTDGWDSHSREGGIASAYEQNIIQAMCKEWCSRKPELQIQILILSPYKAQVQGIKKALFRINRANIDVSTVD